MEQIQKYKSLEELPMREYMMYALGASYSQDFEAFTKQFERIFLLQPERLNPEDHIEHNLEMICDSPNSEYK